MSRLLNRENALKVIYIDLVRDDLEVDMILNDFNFISSVSDFIEPLTLDDEMTAVIKRASERKDIYALALEQYLNNWRFNRLGFMEQALLILACAELEIGLQDKVVVVNEAVRMAKIYADDDSYRLVNGVLDALWWMNI